MRLHCSTCFSLVAASGTFSLVAVHRLLMLQSIGSRAWTSVVAVPGLKNTGSSVVAQGLTCSNACDIFLDEGLNLCLLHWQADSLPLSHQGTLPQSVSFKEVHTRRGTLGGQWASRSGRPTVLLKWATRSGSWSTLSWRGPCLVAADKDALERKGRMGNKGRPAPAVGCSWVWTGLCGRKPHMSEWVWEAG